MGRFFSIQMRSNKNLERIHLDPSQSGILIEGDFGEISNLSLIEEKLLEIQFSNGVLRLEVDKQELIQAVKNCESIS